mmetsp:Transcript_4676/g.16450  ORF Transcript_4676/g.16450 Transcript_4676/m.16450 type:complete len:130 (-) Transcript_4676:39-428(-)
MSAYWNVTDVSFLREGRLSSSNVCGYVSVRKSDLGWRIGPLVASSRPIAEDLFRRAVTHVTEVTERELTPGYSQPVTLFIDIPESNSAALEMAAALQLRPLFQTVRMYTKGEAPVDHCKLYGITSFELG